MSVGGSEPTWGIHIKLSPARLCTQILAFFSHMAEQQSQTLCLCCFQTCIVFKKPLHVSKVHLIPAERVKINSVPDWPHLNTSLIENPALTIMIYRDTNCVLNEYNWLCLKYVKHTNKNWILIYFQNNVVIRTVYPFTFLSK